MERVSTQGRHLHPSSRAPFSLATTLFLNEPFLGEMTSLWRLIWMNTFWVKDIVILFYKYIFKCIINYFVWTSCKWCLTFTSCNFSIFYFIVLFPYTSWERNSACSSSTYICISFLTWSLFVWMVWGVELMWSLFPNGYPVFQHLFTKEPTMLQWFGITPAYTTFPRVFESFPDFSSIPLIFVYSNASSLLC